MLVFLILGLIATAYGDSCTEHNSAAYGKGVGCMSKGCCEFGTYISSLCSGADNACCFTKNTCGSTGKVPEVKAGCPTIISRSGWGARAPKSTSRLPSQPVHLVFIHHGEGPHCTTKDGCSKIVRSYQNYHMNTHGWNDIGYSFLVGEDGNAYEGRGWDHVGAHTKGYNSKALAICIVGGFDSRVPNAAALAAVQELINCGISKGKISVNYVLKGHRDVNNTDCPGQALYNLIRTWSHYG